MRKLPFAAIISGAGLAFGLLACTQRVEKAKVRADFDHICASQRDFLSARKLKGADEAELLVERIRRMREGLHSQAAIQAADRLTQVASAEMRRLAEGRAVEAGLEGWACPELATAL